MTLNSGTKRGYTIAAIALLTALGFFCVMLANAAAFGFPRNRPFGPQGIGVAGMILGTIMLACSSFVVRFGLRTIADRWRQGVEGARQVRSRLETEHAPEVAERRTAD
ncbi:MAG TPA: hypothetical protein VGN42_00795 [Pirellulales bacterium]|jgi:hypothetical protein|nr:hypothetical protein [Pirellulales bacterium]